MIADPLKEPANDAAEQALLGAMLSWPKAVRMAADSLTPEAFYFRGHAQIFAACVDLDRQGIKPDAVSVVSYIDSDQLAQIGGKEYLADLQASVLAPSMTDDYVRLIGDLYLRRQVMCLCDDFRTKASIPAIEEPAQDLVDDFERELRALTTANVSATPNVSIAEAVEASIDQTANAMQVDGLVGVTTGLRCLDNQIGGLQPGDLIVVAARPSIGKTALATNNFALEAARNNVPVAVFSLEMSASQLASRQMASVCRISSDCQRRGTLDNRSFVDLRQAGDDIARLPIYIDDKAGVSSAYVRQRARRLKVTKSIGLVVVDYLQLMRETGRTENRRLEIGQITSSLKALAKELQIPVVLLSQLSRQLEGREDKRPILSDLRESGDIEQDADVVVFLYRHGFYLDQRQPPESSPKYADWRAEKLETGTKAELIIAKNRMGPVGRVFGDFDGVRSVFTDRWEGGNG